MDNVLLGTQLGTTLGLLTLQYLKNTLTWGPEAVIPAFIDWFSNCHTLDYGPNEVMYIEKNESSAVRRVSHWEAAECWLNIELVK